MPQLRGTIKLGEFFGKCVYNFDLALAPVVIALTSMRHLIFLALKCILFDSAALTSALSNHVYLILSHLIFFRI